jgi:HAD superfamily hydrolase (TIGR01509 family)
MDGTLVETESRWWAAERRVMELHGSTWEEDDQNQAIGGPLFKVVEYMGAKANVKAEIIFDQIVEEMLNSFSKFKSELLPGWENIFQEARKQGIKTALVTASNRVLADALLINNSYQDYFDLVITSDDVAETKPHPEPYLAAAKYFGFDVLECLAFEDSNTGITSSLGAGIPTIAIPDRVLLDSRRGMKILSGLQGLGLKDLKEIHKELVKEWQNI